MRKEKGFSLLETVVISGVVVLVSAAAAPSVINASRQYKLKAAAQEVDQALQAAKYDAIRENTSKAVTFNLSTNQMTTSSGKVIQLPAGISFAGLPSDEAAPTMVATGSTAPLASQQTNSKVACSFPVGSNTNERKAMFTSRGIPNVEPGAVNWIYLKNNQNEMAAVTLSSAGSTAKFNKMANSRWKGTSGKSNDDDDDDDDDDDSGSNSGSGNSGSGS